MALAVARYGNQNYNFLSLDTEDIEDNFNAPDIAPRKSLRCLTTPIC